MSERYEGRSYFPGPSCLETVSLGGDRRLQVRAIVWADGCPSLVIETGAAEMQLTCTRAQIESLRDMLTAAIEKCSKAAEGPA